MASSTDATARRMLVVRKRAVAVMLKGSMPGCRMSMEKNRSEGGERRGSS
jgi:hypothetical protein